MAAAQPAGVASPCVSLCRMHAGTGWCEGCLRTIDEIVTWGQTSEAGRVAVLHRLASRRVAWRAVKAAQANAPTEAPTQPGTPPDLGEGLA